MHFGDRHDFGVRLIFEVDQVPLADQAKPDEAQSDPVVGAGHAPVRRGRKRRGGAPSNKRRRFSTMSELAGSDMASHSPGIAARDELQHVNLPTPARDRNSIVESVPGQ